MKRISEMNNNDLLKIEYLSKTYNESSIPLYLSYPTLTCWNNKVDKEEFIEGIRKEKNPFLYFHFPYCKTACYYCLCYKVISSSEEVIDNILIIWKRKYR